MAEELVLYKKEDGIAVVTLNRPEKMNAITREMSSRLHFIMEEIRDDDEVRAVILTGNGRGFCGGTDVGASLGTGDEERATMAIERLRRSAAATYGESVAYWGFNGIAKPTIAAINGPAVGLGAEHCIHCDIRIAADSARIGWVFVLRGWVPDTGAGTWLLPRIVGLSKACELLFSGEIIDAQEMLRIGLVSKVVPDKELMPTAIEMAKKMTKGAPLAIQMSKQLLYKGLERGIEAHLQFNGSAFRTLTQTEDHKEGMRSFLEKRAPHWQSK